MIAYKMINCTQCGDWIDEGDEFFYDKDGDEICENCNN